MNAPVSPFRIEQAMSVAQSLRGRLLIEDPEMAADAQLMHDTLEGQTDVYEVMRRVARYALDAECLADAARARMMALAARRARYDKRVSDARGALFAMLDALGEVRLDDAEFTATIRPGGKAVVITDVDALPAAYVRTERVPDKAEIARALKSGIEISGATLNNGVSFLQLKAT